MEYTIPHYFEQFRCVAAECQDTCCAGWAIMIDEPSLEKYKMMEGAFGNRLRNSIDWEKGCFCQYEKRCAFLNEENLCDLHIEAGEHMLCDTCRDYPRHMEEFEGLREGSLSLSCIEAAKIILGCKEPVQFLHFEDDAQDEEYEEFDYLLFTKLMDAREVIFQVLQTREIDIMTRIGVVLEFSAKFQKAVNRNELFQIDAILAEMKDSDAYLSFAQRSAGLEISGIEYYTAMRKIFRVFQKMEVLKSDWSDYVKRAERTLYGNGQQSYEALLREFQKSRGEEWSVWIEQLMVYFVFTYFCGAVYDQNVLGKMQTAVVSTLLICELALAKWMEEDKRLNFEQFVDIAHRVSRELEHSDSNLVRMEKICNQTSVFHTQELLRVILY